jgi:immunoglobulin-binding protein 1
VSAAGLFSRNENIEEVSSLNVRYLLLPALLGRLSLQIASDASGRLDIVLLAEAYFKDFLRRCRDYGVVEHDQVATVLDPDEPSNQIVVKSAPKGADLAAMVQVSIKCLSLLSA